jgi:hypothetical protein
MLADRIIGAFTFRKGVYEEVEHDVNFTSTAWIIVVVVAFASSLGSGSSTDLVGRFIGSVVGTIFTVVGFAVATYVISWLGKTLFQADVSFDEMVRTLGLAYVWNVVGFIGILSIISETLSCLLAPVTFAAALLGLAAWFVAAREALDLDWVQTIVTVIVGWVVMLAVGFFATLVIGILGFGAGVLGGLFSL